MNHRFSHMLDVIVGFVITYSLAIGAVILLGELLRLVAFSRLYD